MPCNYQMRAQAAKIKEGIRDAGGTPMEFNTIAISDGITMGTSGMRASLVSREVIADSIELVARGHFFDAVVCLAACDKTLPGVTMALARLNLPGLMLYGGSIMPGKYKGEDVTIQEVFEAIGAHAAGRITEQELIDLENVASPGSGACGGQFTANTMAMALEVLGISPMGAAMVPAENPSKAEVAYEAGRLVMDVLARGQRPRDIITKEGLENAIAAVATSGGSTNGVLHLLAIASEAGVELDIDDFDRISSATPMLCDLKPGGRYVAADLHQAGGVPVVVKRLQELGRLNEDAMTVTGRTVGEHAAEAQETEGQRVVRPLDEPIKATGGLAILRGNLAPEGCVVKLSGHERVHHQGPARVFENEEAAMAAVTAGADPGRRRRRHPQRGPRRRPGHARDAGGHRGARGGGARRRRRAHHRRALLRRHPRLHGRPRRARGGPRRPDHRRPGRRHGHHRRRRRAGSTSTCPTTRSPAASRPTSSRRRARRTACSASTRSWCRAPPRAPSRASGLPRCARPRPRAARLLGEELPQQPVEALGPLEHRHVPGALEHLAPRVRDQLLQPRGVLDRHQRVVRAPHDQRRAADLRQLLVERVVGQRLQRGQEAVGPPRAAHHLVGELGGDEVRIAEAGGGQRPRCAAAAAWRCRRSSARERARRHRVGQPREPHQRLRAPAVLPEDRGATRRRAAAPASGWRIASSAPMKPPIELPTTRGRLDRRARRAARQRPARVVLDRDVLARHLGVAEAGQVHRHHAVVARELRAGSRATTARTRRGRG